MARKRWFQALCLLLAGIGRLASVHAEEVDLNATLAASATHGVVLLAISYATVVTPPRFAYAEVKWRKAGTKDLGSRLTLRPFGAMGSSADEDSAKRGRVLRYAALKLPPGDYEIFDANAHYSGASQRGINVFSKRFSAVAGEVRYAGNLDFTFSTSRNAVMVGILISPLIGGGSTTYPVMMDDRAHHVSQLEKALPHLVGKIAPVVQQDDEDKTFAARAQAARDLAERGGVLGLEAYAFALLGGVGFSADGEVLRVPTDVPAAIRYFERAIEQKSILGAAWFGGGLTKVLDSKFSDLLPVPGSERHLDLMRYAAQRHDVTSIRSLISAIDEGKAAAYAPEKAVWQKRLAMLESDDPKRLPFQRDDVLKAYTAYQSANRTPKVFLLGEHGFAWSTFEPGPTEAWMTDAINDCKLRNRGVDCRMYARTAAIQYPTCFARIREINHDTRFPDPSLPEAMPDSGKALSAGAQAGFALWLGQRFPRAFVAGPSGEHYSDAGDCLAVHRAKSACAAKHPVGCRLFAQDDRLVSDDPAVSAWFANLPSGPLPKEAQR